MITISRDLARQFRAVCRKALGSSAVATTAVQLSSTGRELRIKAGSEQLAIEYLEHQSGEADTITVPLELLAACEGRQATDVVQVRTTPGGQIIAEWDSGGVPQQQWFEGPSQEFALPPAPTQTTLNPGALFAALQAAAETTDALASRFALGCLRLSGTAGSIAATDGRQLLVHEGWQFPWTEDRLVPASPVFGCRVFQAADSVRVAETEGWITLGSGSWTIWLRIDNVGRFPQVDDLVRPSLSACAQLKLSPADAQFAAAALARFPLNRAQGDPLTLDLNGDVLVRAQANPQTLPIELLLADSHLEGQPLQLVTGGQYLRRALTLGFTELNLFGTEAAVQARDSARTYLWMPLSGEQIVPAGPTVKRLVSPPAPQLSPRAKRARRTKQAAASPSSDPPTSVTKPPAGFTSGTASTDISPVEQLSQLRGVLKLALAQSGELLRSLQRQRKTSRQVDKTLHSLRQLHPVA